MKPYENAIEIDHLCKSYDGFTLDHISFCVPKGSIMGFIGQNGAGKSTTIHTILNIIKADNGKINIFGLDHLEHEYEIKEHIAAIFDALPFHDQLTAKQLNIIMRGIYREWSSETFFNYLERMQLPARKKFGQFSKGMKMKLQIAAALSHNAKLLIMDEATTGLDPVVRNEILDMFQEYLGDENNSILMSSHITSDLDRIADSVTFIHKGKLLLSGYKDDILETHAIMKCTKKEYADIDPADMISARINDFGAEVLVADRKACELKYKGLLLESTVLEELMRYYVNAEKKEWTI